MQKAKYKCMTKATNREKGEPRLSHNWIISKRGIISFYEDRLELGSWKFDYSNIHNPIFYVTKQMFIPVKILTFEYENMNYQFGLNPWVNPLPHLPFSPKIENVSMKLSVSSMIIRIAILGYIIYTLIQYCPVKTLPIEAQVPLPS